MKGSKASVTVTVNGRRPVTEYISNGQVFIEGRAGSEFELDIRNNTGERVMAIISIDGLSVINGGTAGVDSPGYVINAYSSIKIPGWMLSNGSAAKFTFSGKRESYSQLSSGTSQNCGVIGVMVWSEKRPVQLQRAIVGGSLSQPWVGPFYGATTNSVGPSYSLNATSAVATNASVNVNNLGTSFGAETEFKTVDAVFNKDQIIETLVMYYDDARGLKARGIEVTRERTRSMETPNPFPGSFCTPPKGW